MQSPIPGSQDTMAAQQEHGSFYDKSISKRGDLFPSLVKLFTRSAEVRRLLASRAMTKPTMDLVTWTLENHAVATNQIVST